MSRRLLSVLVAAATVAAGLAVLPVATSPAHADVTGTGGDYVQLPSAAELADTRYGNGVPKAPLGAAGRLAVPVLGHGGVPASGVSAVQVSLIGYSPSAGTWLSMYPDGATDLPISSLNIPAATVELSNTAVVQVGSDGKIGVYNASGTINVAVAVLGYYTTSTAVSGPGGFTPVPFNRVVDTRSGLGATKAMLAAGKGVTVSVTGGNVPGTADSVYLDVIATGATKPGWISDYPYAGTVSGMTVLAFGPGTTGHELVVKPGSGGRVTFVNNSAAAIDLVLTQEGYTSNASNAGSGFHSARQRLVSSASIAANATMVVPIVGRPGLPTQHITGALLSLAAYGSTVGGYLKAWGTGNSEPSASTLDFPAKATRAGLTVVGVGSNGTVTIRNNASATVSFYVDLEGWFSDEHRSVATAQFSPTVALQLPASAASGVAPVEYSYVDNVGRLLVGVQSDPDNFRQVTWAPVSTIGDVLSGPPSLTLQSDKSVLLSAQSSDTTVLTKTQAAGSTTWSSAFSNTGGSFSGAPAVGTTPSGAVYSFAVDDAGALWIRAAGASTSWTRNTSPTLVGTPTVVTSADGIKVFALTTTGTVVTADYQGGAALSAWIDLGGTGVVDRPAVAVRPGYLDQVVIRQGDGSIATKAQASNGSYPTGWAPVGSINATGAPATIFDPVTGQIEILVRNAADHHIYNSGETVQGSQTWRDWTDVTISDDPALPDKLASATDPTISPFTGATNGNGWFAPYRTSQNVTETITRTYNGSPAFEAAHPSYRVREVAGPPAG